MTHLRTRMLKALRRPVARALRAFAIMMLAVYKKHRSEWGDKDYFDFKRLQNIKAECDKWLE